VSDVELSRHRQDRGYMRPIADPVALARGVADRPAVILFASQPSDRGVLSPAICSTSHNRRVTSLSSP